MSLFKQKVPTVDAGAPPKEGAARFAHILSTHPVRLIGLSILFTCTSLPVLTIPASLAGLCHITDKMEKGEGTVFVLKEYFTAFIDDFMNRLVTYIATISIPCMLFIGTVSFGLETSYAAGGSIAVWLILRGVYDWLGILLEEMKMSFGACLKDAFILFFSQWKRSMLLLLTLAAEVALIWFLYPYSLLVFFFFLFGTRQYLVSRLCCKTVRRVVGDEKE